jgi:SOS response regulatory protein OraA/RecX
MAKLLYIRDVSNTLLLLGVFERGECVRYKLSRALYAEMGSPAKGAELSDDAIELIRQYDEEYRAKKKALSLLSYSDKNEAGLKIRLAQAGFSRDVAERTAEEMVNLGYIDEGRQLERIILNEANVKLRGPMKILPYLIGKGYSSDDVKRVMRELSDRGEIDFKANAKKLAEKRLSGCRDSEEIKKLLYRNGYKI